MFLFSYFSSFTFTQNILFIGVYLQKEIYRGLLAGLMDHFTGLVQRCVGEMGVTNTQKFTARQIEV